jgi:hypothetical protein
MRKKTYLFMLFLLLIPKVLLSQDIDNKGSAIYKKNQIGIQLNPYLDESLFQGTLIKAIFGVRYGYRLSKPLLVGAEVSGTIPYYFHKSNYPNFYSFSAGIFTRYSVPSGRRIQCFLEVSPYFSHYYHEWKSTFDQSSFTRNKFGYYVAPGVTLYSKSKKFSFDLYYKFSNLPYVNANKSVISYKVNFNF